MDGKVCGDGPRLVEQGFVDARVVYLVWREGEVVFPREEGPGAPCDGSDDWAAEDNRVDRFGALDLAAACDRGAWNIRREAPGGGGAGHPVAVYRKTRINGMAQLPWDNVAGDFRYEAPVDHWIYLALPRELGEGETAVLEHPCLGPAYPEGLACTFRFRESRSPALHGNLNGYNPGQDICAIDLYHWMGDGGERDFSGVEGRTVWLVRRANGGKGAGETVAAGTVRRGAGRSREGDNPGGWFRGHDLTGSTDWIADVAPGGREGTWCVAVEGVGCGAEFVLAPRRYRDPFRTCLRGFYYMRLGERPVPGVAPVPRSPAWIPGEDPADCRVLLTSMHPWHPEWETFAPGDKWDPAESWEPFVLPGRPENPKARGGHADALDQDRHLGHVSIVFDMLLPFWLARGLPGDDGAGIPESGNGIPDLLDEARNEVDFWLSLRSAGGYSHGCTNPSKNHVIYQAAPTAMAAWAVAALCAFLSACLELAARRAEEGGGSQASPGLLKTLADFYHGAARDAWDHASGLPREDQDLDRVQNVGMTSLRGRDFRMLAAVFLREAEGPGEWDGVLDAVDLGLAPAGHAPGGKDVQGVLVRHPDRTWAWAGLLFSSHPLPEGLGRALEAGLLAHARAQVAGADLRPSRRCSELSAMYFHTAQQVQTVIIAHALAREGRAEPGDEDAFARALLRESDWSLGRNPLDKVQMTVASSPLAHLPGVRDAYTSGRRTGVAGLHPGHTPYANCDDWGSMIMARPSWMGERGWPVLEDWPRGEAFFDTRWVWAHAEFTPQQTMRGKMALYAWLDALGY